MQKIMTRKNENNKAEIRVGNQFINLDHEELAALMPALSRIQAQISDQPMKYYTRVIANEILIEVQIARDERPGAGYIAAHKLRFSLDGENRPLPFATVQINVAFSGDLSFDEVDDFQRWLSLAAKMARLLDIKVTGPEDFTEAVSYEVRQVAGTLILDKKVR